MTCVVIPNLAGGLGNMLFQVAAAVKFSQDGGATYKISKNFWSKSHHSQEDYFASVFARFPIWTQEGHIMLRISEPSNFHNHPDYVGIVRSIVSSGNTDALLLGYFQRHEFVPRGFRDMLNLPAVDSSRVKDTCFLHIRGGDYVNHWFHDTKLHDYYVKCIAIAKEAGITKFSIFTNDKPYALQQSFLKDIDHEFIDAPELESIVLMSECKAGICPNSTFSWWGAYFNPDRLICMPSKWFNDPNMNVTGYFFPGVTIVSV